MVSFKSVCSKSVIFLASIKTKPQSLVSDSLHVRNYDPEPSLVI